MKANQEKVKKNRRNPWEGKKIDEIQEKLKKMDEIPK